MKTADNKIFEGSLAAAWTGRDASPYPGQIPISDPDAAKTAVRQSLGGSIFRVRDFFRDYPFLGIWATLAPLAEEYGRTDTNIYTRIGKSLGLKLDDQYRRELFKSSYRGACRKVGLLVSGNSPSDLFFPPLGVADSKITEWADALVAALNVYGPPAIEDTPSALSWQRRARGWMPETLARPRAAIDFDTTAYYAERVTHWRRGKAPRGPRDEALFKALDNAIAIRGLKKDRFVGPPQLIWHADGLALLAEASKVSQTITVGPFPQTITAAKPFGLPDPWPETVTWTATRMTPIPVTPSHDEIFLFDVDTGALQATLTTAAPGSVAIRAERVVALAYERFAATDFGPSVPARDARFQMAWVGVEEALQIGDARFDLLRLQEPSITVRAPVLGRSGSKVLRAGAPEGVLDIQVYPELEDGDRILRITLGDRTLHRIVQTDKTGRALISFADLGLTRPADPGTVTFELLVAGAAQDQDARAVLKATEHIWPGVAHTSNGLLENIPAPRLFDVARSAGFHLTGGRLTLDPGSDVDVARLALTRGEATMAYNIPFRGVRVWRHRVTTGAKERVPLRANMKFVPDDRQDSLTIEAPGSQGNLVIFGRGRKRPFFARTRIEIPASDLAASEQQGDDRILLEDPAGGVQLLARVMHMPAARAALEESVKALHVTFTPSCDIDAVGVRILGISGEDWTGADPLRSHPVERPLPSGCQVTHRPDGQIELRLPRSWVEPARADILIWPAGQSDMVTERDADGLHLSLGLTGPGIKPGQENALANLIAEPTTESFDDQVTRALAPALNKVLEEHAKKGLVTPLLQLWRVTRTDGGVPRGDLLSAAPGTFEAALTAYGGLSGNGLLHPLGQMGHVAEVADLPDPQGDDPLGAWLDRLAAGTDLPPQLDAASLDRAFIALGNRLDAHGLRSQITSGTLSSTIRVMTEAYSQNITRLQAHDRLTGHTELPARIFALLERFARASRLKQSANFLDATVRRTDLAPSDIGGALTLLIRAAPEAFAHFLTLWDQAVRAHATETEAT